MWMGLVLAAPTHLLALCCDQPTAVMNGYLLCPRSLGQCTITTPQTVGPPSASCPVLGCDLDFGTRPVTIAAPIDVAAGTLGVKAATVTVAAAIEAVAPRQDAAVEMTAVGTD